MRVALPFRFRVCKKHRVIFCIVSCIYAAAILYMFMFSVSSRFSNIHHGVENLYLFMHYSELVDGCFRVRKTNNLQQVSRHDTFQRQIKLIMFNYSQQDLWENPHGSQTPCLRQSWPSLGKLHLQSSFRNQKTQSQIREDQAQARFQEQSWKAVWQVQEKIAIAQQAQHAASVQVQPERSMPHVCKCKRRQPQRCMTRVCKFSS